MVMILVLFGNLFSASFLFIGGGDVITDLLIGGELQPAVVMFIMLFAIFLLGMFIDWVAILLVCLPVYMPICLELGFRPPVVFDADLHRAANLLPDPAIRLCPLLFCRGSAGRSIQDDSESIKA